MKTNFFLIPAICAFSIVAASCEKCSECHYESTTGSEVEIGEYCDDELENIEANGYYNSVEDTTYTVHCHSH